jgi:hypothetical protein
MVVYKITNLANGKIYIGKTTKSLGRRWAVHKYMAKIGKGCPILSAAIRKYGAPHMNSVFHGKRNTHKGWTLGGTENFSVLLP